MDKDFPHELEDSFADFNTAMNNAEDCLSTLLKTDRSNLVRNVEPLDAVKLDLVAVYAMNSFYWSYLIMQGVDPKTHGIKQELDRIRKYMLKVEELKNKKNAPRLEKEAAKRFIKNAMFDKDAKRDTTKELQEDKNEVEEAKDNSFPNKKSKSMKRKNRCNKSEKASKKAKTHKFFQN